MFVINLRYHFADPLNDTGMIQRNLLYNVFARPGVVSGERILLRAVTYFKPMKFRIVVRLGETCEHEIIRIL